MDLMANIWLGLAVSLQPTNLFMLFAGTVVGILVGALPGISGPMVIALFVPLSYTMDIIPALEFMTAVYAGSVYGGSITAILFKMPGDPGNAATCFDGYPMARKGLGSKALGISAATAAIGGLFSSLVLLLLTPLLADAALKIGPAEYFAVTLLGMAAVTTLGAKSQAKAAVSCIVGLLLATVGTDEVTGAVRFSFGSTYLNDAIPMTAALIGLFAMTEVFDNVAKMNEGSSGLKGARTVLPSLKELWGLRGVISKSSLIGTWVGIMPATGATVATFLAYAEVVRSSKHPEKFGTGIIEGVAAPEAAGNAAVGGSYVPMLALGIPGSASAAIIMGAFTLHGLRPGPLLFQQQTELAYAVIMGMFIANLMFLVGGVLSTRYLAKVLAMPSSLLMPTVVMLCVVGGYAMRNSMADVWFTMGFGVIGYLLISKAGFSVGALVLGFVLGGMMETNFRRAILMEGDVVSAILLRPISGPLVVLAVVLALSPWLRQIWRRAAHRSEEAPVVPAQQ